MRIGRSVGSAGIAVVGLAVMVVALLASGGGTARSEAATAHCQPVVKAVGGEFFKASVLVVHPGQATCSEARKVLWKTIIPGGWGEGTVRGVTGPAWSCKSPGFNGNSVKCVREDPEREVIKRGFARVCPHCTANKS